MSNKTASADDVYRHELRERLNILNEGFWRSLNAALDEAEAQGKKAFYIVQANADTQGQGKVFSSGLDLKALRSGNAAPLIEAMMRTLHRLRTLPLATAVYCSGDAIAGSVFVFAACDLRFVGSSASFFLNEVHNGFPLSTELIDYVRCRTAPHTALRLCAYGIKVGAEEAVKSGLATQLVQNDQQAMQVILEHAASAAPIMKEIKQNFYSKL